MIIRKSAICILVQTKSDVQTQSTKVWKRPTITSFNLFYKKITVFDTRRNGFEENIEHVRQAFQCFPMKSIRTAARQLELPCLNKVLHKNLRLYAYKVQMLQALQPNDAKTKRRVCALCN